MDNDNNTNNSTSTDTPKKSAANWEEMYGKKKNGGKKGGKKGPIIAIVVIVVILVIGIAAANGFKKLMKTAKKSMGDGTLVEEFDVKDMSAYIETTGIVESQEVHQVVTNLQYPVKEIKVEVGDRVKKGDVVCVIDDKEICDRISDLELQASDEDKHQAKEIEIANRQLAQTRESSNTTIANASQDITDAKNAWDEAILAEQEAEKEYKKAEKAANKLLKKATNTDALEKNPIITAASAAEAEYKSAHAFTLEKEAAYNAAINAYNTATQGGKEAVQSAQNSNELTLSSVGSYSAVATELAKYYDMKEKTVILAEQDGVVTSISAVVGLPVSGTIMQIENDNKLQLTVDIKERDIFKINKGMNAELSSTTLEQVEGTGKVDKVYDFISDAQTSAQTSLMGQAAPAAGSYKALIKVDKSENVLLGMNIKVKISTGEELHVNAVPYTAILTDVDGDYVYRAKEVGNGMYTVERVNVEKGASGDYYTEIIDDSLEKGDKIISYPNTVSENAVITIKE